MKNLVEERREGERRGDATLIGIPPASPLSPVSYPAASTRRLGGAIFQARVCCLLIINSPTESQRLAELEASRLSCVRPLQKIGRNLDFAPSEGARRWCLCSDVRAGVGGGGGGYPAGRIQGPLPGCQRGIKLQKTDVKRCCVFSSLLSNLLFSPRRSILRMSLSPSSSPFAGSFPSSLAPPLPPPPVRRLPLCQLLPFLHTQAWSRPLLPSCWPRQRWLFSREASNLQPRPSRLHRWVSMENPRQAFRGRTRAISDYAVVCLSFFFFLLSLLLVFLFLALHM